MKRSEELIQQQAMDQVSGLTVLQDVVLQTHEIFIYVKATTPFGFTASTSLGFVRRRDFPSSKFKYDQMYRADVVFIKRQDRLNLYKPYEETIREMNGNLVDAC